MSHISYSEFKIWAECPYKHKLKYIDKVVTFKDTKDLETSIEIILPDIMVIGSDWEGKTVVGEQYTDKLIFFNRIGNYSTTNILNGETNNI